MTHTQSLNQQTLFQMTPTPLFVHRPRHHHRLPTTHNVQLARMAESHKIKLKFPDRVPVIVERAEGFGCGDAPPIDKNKFLIPANLTVGQLVLVIRRRIGMSPADALFVFVSITRKTNRKSSNGFGKRDGEEHTLTLPPTSISLAEVFEQSKDEDGFLYVKYAGENVFGAKGGRSSSSASGGSSGRRPPRTAAFSPPASPAAASSPSPPLFFSSATFTPSPSTASPAIPSVVSTAAAAASSASDFVASKPGVCRRFRNAVASRRAKKRATQDAKMLESASAAHRSAVGTLGLGRFDTAGDAGDAGGIDGVVPAKTKHLFSKAEREEMKRLRRPMLGAFKHSSTTTSTTHNPSYRNYGTMPADGGLATAATA